MTDGNEKKNRSRSPPKRRKETIQIDDQWLTRDQIATKIQEILASGNTKFGKWADALDNLDARLMVKAENKLDEAKEYLKDNRKIIEDIAIIEEHIAEAKSLLGEKKYESSLDESFEVMDRIHEIRHERYSSEVGDLLDETEKLVDENREMGMDVSVTVSIIEKTRKQLEKQEYEEALELSHSTLKIVRSKQKEFLKNKAALKLSSIEKSLEETRVLGLVTDDIETRFTALGVHYESEEFKEFLEKAGSLETILKEARDRKNAELLNSELQEFITLTEKAREMGVGVDKERKAASRIDELIRTEGYIAAINTIKKHKKSLNEGMRIRRRRNCTQRLRRASRELTLFQKEARMAFPDMQEFRDLAFDALEKEDYDEVESNLDRFNEAWDQQKLELRIAKYDRDLEQRESEIDAITQMNIDLTDVGEVISEARKSISAKDFERVDASIAELDAVISEAKGDRAGKLATDQMETSGNLLERMKEKGIDVEELEVTMEKAREAFATSDNLEAYRLAQEVERGLVDLRTGARKKIVSKLLDDVKVLQSKATELWLDTGDFPEKADKAKSLFADGDYVGAKELSLEARTGLARMLNEKQMEIYQFRYDELAALSEKAREMKMDISDEMKGMYEIEKLRDAKEYDEAIEIMKELKRTLEKKLEDHEVSANEKLLEKAEDELLALEKATGRQFEDLGGLLDMVSSALDDGDYDKMGSILNDFYRIKGGYDADYKRENYTAKVQKLKNGVESLNSLGIDLNDAVPLIEKAETLLSEELFDDLEETLSELEPLYGDIITKRVKKRTGLIVKEINMLFKRLIERGTELDTDKELFNEIVHAIKGDDYLKACKLAIKSRKLLLKKDKRYTAKEVGTRLKEAKDLFQIIKDHPHIAPERVNELKSIMETVETSLESNELDEAQRSLSELTDAEEEMVGEKKKAGEIVVLMEKVNDLTQSASELSIDIEAENDILDDIDELLNNYELDETIPLLKEVYESMLSKLDLRQRDECRALLHDATERFEEYRDILEDHSLIASQLDRAQQDLDAEEYEKSLELSQSILKEIEGTRLEQWEQEIRELLRSSDKLIQETQELDGDTARVEAIYYKATYYLEKRDYENGKKYATMALDGAMKSRMALDKSAAAVLVDEIRAIKGEAESNDLPTDVLESLISEAEGFAEEARQEEISVILARAKDEFRKAEVFVLLKGTTGLMEKAVGLWLEVDEHKLIMEQAEEAYKNGEFDRASTIAGKTKEALTILIDSTFKEKMELQGKKVITLLKGAEKLGVDTRNDSRILSGLRKMKEEGRYEEATKVLLEAISSIEKKNDQRALDNAREGLENLEKTAGLESDDLNTLMEKADKALAKGNRKGFTKILEDFHTSKERFVRSLSQKKYSSEINEFESQLDEFEGVGLDVSVPRKILEEVDEALTEKRLDDAKEGLARLSDIMKDIRRVKIRDLAWENFGQAEEIVEETLVLNIDVTDSRQLLRQARRAMRQGDFIKGTSISSEVRDLCEKLRLERQSEEHSLTIKKAREFIESLRQLDDFPDLYAKDMGRVLEDAEEALEARKTDEFLKLIDEFKELENNTKLDIEKTKDARSKMTELEKLLEEARGLDIDVEDDEKDMNEAGELLGEGKYQELFALLEDTRSYLLEKIEELNEKKAVTSFEKAGETFEIYRETLRDKDMVETRISEIQELIDGRKFDEAQSLSEDLMSSMELSREKSHREELEAALDRLWEYISENEKLDIDTSKAEGLFYKSKYFTEKGELENANNSMNAAKEKAEEGRKAYEKENATRTMDEVENLMEVEAGLAIDFSELEEEINEANEFFDQGKYLKSWKMAEKIMVDLTDKITNRYLELISQGKDALSSLINKGKGLGADMTEGIARLSAVDELRDEREYRKALEQIVDIRVLAEQQIAARLAEINSDKLDDAAAELDELKEETGNDYGDLRGMLDEARKALEGIEYDELDAILAEFADARTEHNAVYLVGKYTAKIDELDAVAEDLSKLGVDMKTAGISSEVRESIEDRDFNAVTEGLTELEHEITEARDVKAKMRAKEVIGVTNKLFTEMKKLAVDVKRENKIFKEVLVAVRNRDYVTGIRLTLEARAGLLNAKRDHYREKSSQIIGNVEASMDEGRELEIDVTRVEELHEEAMKCYEEEDYEEAFKLIEEARSSYAKDRCEYFREKASKSMELMKSMLTQAGELWIDVDEFQDILSEMKRDYDEESYEDMLEKSEGANSDLAASIEEKLLENIGKKAEVLAKIMDEALGLDVDVVPERQGLQNVEELKQQKKYNDIIDLLDHSMKSIEEKIAAKMKEINSEKVGKVREELEALEEETDMNYDDLWEFLESAENAFNEVDYSSQDSIIQEFRKAKADHYQQYLADRYDKKAKELLRESEELKELGLTLTPAIELLETVKENVDNFDFTETEATLEKIEEQIENAKTEQAKELAKNHFIKTKKLLTELKGKELKLEEENKAFQRAIAAIKSKDFVTACRLTRQAVEMAENAREQYYKERAEEELEWSKDMVIEGVDLDLEFIHECLERAEDEYDEADYEKSIQSVDAARSDFKERRTAYWKKRAEDALEKVRDKTKEGYELELDMQDVETLIADAESYFQEGDHERVMELTREAEEKYSAQRRDHFMEKGQRSLAQLDEVLVEGNELGLDTGKIQETRGLTASLFDEGHYERAIDMAEQGRKDYHLLRQAHFKENTDAVLKKLKTMIGEASEFEVDISAVKDDLRNIRSLYDQKEFQEAQELSENSMRELRREIDGEQITRLNDEITGLEEEMDSARGIETDIREEEDGLTSVENMRAEGSYRDCIIRVGQLRSATKQKYELKIAEVNAGKLEETMESLENFSEETGGEYPDLDELAASAGKALEEKDYTVFEELLERFRTTKEDENRKYLFTKYKGEIEELEGEVPPLAELGLDLSSVEELVGTTREHMESYEFEMVIDDIASIREGLLEVRNVGAKNLAKKHFLSTKSVLGELKELDLVVEEFDILFKKAIASIKGRDFVSACQLFLEAGESMAEARKEYYRGSTEETVNNIKKFMGEAAELELNVTAFTELDERVRESYEDGEFEEAHGLALECSLGLQAAINTELLVIIEGKADKFESIAAEALKIDANIEAEKVSLAEADRLREKERYREIISLLENAISSAIVKIEERTFEMNEERFEGAKEALEELEFETGVNYPDLHSQLDEAKEMLVEKNYTDLVPSLMEFDKAREMLYISHLMKVHNERIGGIEEELGAIRDVGIELADTDELSGTARVAINEERFEDAKAVMDELDGIIDEAKSVKAKQIAKSNFTETNKLLTKLKRLGIDLTSEEAVFREILGAIKTRDFLKSIQLTRSVREKLDGVKKDHSRNKAVAAIQSLEGMLGDAGKRITDVISIEKIHSKAMEHFEEEDFDNALLMVGQAKQEYDEKRKEFQQEMLTGSMDRLQNLISEAGELDMDVSVPERNLAQLKSSFDSEKFDEAEELAGDTISTLESTMEKRYLTVIEERTGELARVMEEGVGLGVDMKAERERLSATMDLRTEKRYPEILIVLKECYDSVANSVGDRRRELNTEKLREIMDSLESFKEETGGAYQDLDSLLDSAGAALNREDYEAMEGFIDEFLEAKEGHNNRHMAEGYAARLEEMEKEVGELENIGLSLENVHDLLRIAKENAETFVFKGIETKLSDIETVIDRASSVEAKKLAKKHFIRAKELIAELKETGVDLEEENRLFREAITDIKAGEFVKGAGLTQRSEKLLVEKRKNYYVEATESELEKVDYFIIEAREVDLSLDEILESSKEAREFLEEKLYPQAFTLSRATAAALREMLNVRLKEILDDERAQMESGLEAARKLDLVLDNVTDALAMAGECQQAGDLRKAIDLLRNERPALDEAMRGRTRELTEQAVITAKENLGAFMEITEKDYPDLEGFIENATMSLEDNDYEGAKEHLGMFDEALAGYEGDRRADNYRVDLRSREPEIAAITEIGIELTDIFDLVSQASQLISSHDFEVLEETLVLIDQGIEHARKVTAKDAARDRIATAKGLFDKLTELDLELDEEKKHFGEVLSKIKEGDFVKACKMADGATEMLRKKETEYQRSRAEEALAAAENSLEEIRKLDVETAAVEKSLGEARVFYEWKDYPKSEETARTTVERAEYLKEEYRKKSVFVMIEGVEEALKEGAELGIDTASMAVEIADAYGLVNEGNLEEAERMARETNDLFLSTKKTRIEEITTTSFETARKLMEKSVELGLDTVSIETMLEYANIHFEDGEYESAQELIDQARETLVEMIGGKELEGADSEIAAIESLMREAGKYSVDVGEHEGRFARMNQLRNDGAYNEIITLGREIRESITEKIDLSRSEINSRRLSDAMAKLDEHTSETSEEHPGMEAALNAAREAIEVGDHVAVDSKIDEFEELLKESKRKAALSAYYQRLDMLTGEVTALGDAGIDVTATEELLANVGSELNFQRFEAAETILGKLESIVHEGRTVTARKLAKKHAGEAMKLFSYLGDHGVDLQEEKALFREVRTHVVEERFTDACRILINIKSKLNAAETKYHTEQSSRAIKDLHASMSEAIELEIDVSDLQPSESEARAAYDEGLFDAALENSMLIIDELGVRIGKKRWETVVSELTLLEPVLEEVRAMSIDIDEESSRISEIEALKDGWKFQEALGIIGEVKRSLLEKTEDMNRTDNLEKIDVSARSLADLEEMTGKVYEELHGHLETASKALLESDHTAVNSILESFHADLESSKREYMSDSYSSRLIVLEEDMTRLASVGIELTEAAEFIAGIRNDISSENLGRTGEGLAVVEKLLDEARGEGAKEMARTLFAETKKLMTDMKESGVEAGDVEGTFRQAVISIKNSDFLTGCELLLESRKVVSAALDAYYEERAHSTLAELDKLIHEAEEMGGIDLDDVLSMMETGRNLLVEENYGESHDIVGRAVALVRERIRLRWEDILAEKTDEVNQIVQRSMEFGMEVRDELERLGPVSVLREEGRYGEAVELVGAVGISLSNKHKEGMGLKNAQKLSEAELAFKQFQEMTGDESEALGAHLIKAREAITAEDHAALEEHLDSFSHMREDQSNILLARKYQDELDGFQEIFESYREVGLDISPGIGMISEARSSISENRFGIMEDIISRLGDFKESAANVQAKEIAKVHLGEAKTLLVEVKGLGVEMESNGEIFSEVLGAVKARDFVSACHAAVQVKKRLSDSRKKHLESNADLLLEDTANRLAEAKELGLDVAAVEDIVGNAHAELSEGKLEEASNLAKEAKVNLDAVFDEHFREKYLATAELAERMLFDLKSLGVPTAVVEEKFANATSLFNDSMIREAYVLIEEVAGEISRSRGDSLRERAAKAIETAKIVHTRCGELGLELSSAEEILINAQTSFEEGSFEEAFNDAEEAAKLLSEAEEKYLKRDTSALISAVWNMMGESSEMGLDLGPIEEKIAMAQESLKEGELEVSYALAIASRSELTEKINTKLQVSYEAEYEEFSGILAQFQETGADTDNERNQLAGIEELKKAGNYTEAVSTLIKLKMSVLEEIENMQEEATTRKISEKISTLEELEKTLGQDLSDLKGMLLSSQEAVGNKNLDAADALLRQFDVVIEQYLGEMKVKDFQDRIEELSDSVIQLGELGLDASKGLELLSIIMEGVQENDIASIEENIPHLEDYVKHAKTVDARELAKRHIVEIKKLFGEMKADGIDTSREDEMLKDVVGAIKDQDFIAAIQLTKKAHESLIAQRDRHFTEDVSELLAETRTLLGEGGELGLDTAVMESKLAEGQHHFENGDFQLAAEHASQAKEMFQTAKQHHYRDFTTAALGVVQELMIDEMELEVDMVAVEDMVANAKRNLEKGNFERSAKYAGEAKSALLTAQNEYSRNNASAEIENVRAMVEEAEKLDLEVSFARQALGEMEEHFGQGRFREAREVAKETQGTVRQSLNARLKSDIRAEMVKLSPLMDTARELNLDIREDTSVLARVERLKDLGKYYEAMSTVKGIETSLANKIHLYRRRAGGDRLVRAMDKVTVLEKEILEMPGLDMDITELKDLLSSATAASDSSDFESAESFLEEFFTAEEKYSNVLIDAYPKEVERLAKELMAFNEIGIVLAVAEELVNSIKENIGEGQLEPARELRNQVLEIINDAGKAPAKDIAKQHITSLKISFKYLKEREVDLTEEETLFRKVLVALKEENYVKGIQLMLRVEERLGQKRQEFFKTGIGSVLADVDRIVRQASQKKLDIRDSRKLAFEARALLKRKKFEKSMELAEKARSLLTEVWQNSLEENARIALEEIRAAMEEKSGGPLELGGVAELVEKAVEENGKGEFISCIEHVEEARSMILALEQEDLMELATERLTRAMDFIAEAEEAGMDTEELEGDMIKAQAHFDEGKYNETVVTVNRMEEMVRTVKLSRAETRVGSQLKEFDSFIGVLDTKPYLSEEYKADIRGKVAEVHELFDSGEFLVAEDKLGDLREILEGLMAKIKLEDEFRSLVKEAGDLIARGKENGIEVSEEEKGYEEAVTRKEEGDLEGAITTLLEVHESLIGTVGELLMEKAQGLLSETEQVVKENREIIEDMSAFEELMGRAKDNLAAGNPEGCMVLLGEIQTLLDENRENRAIGEVEANITRAKEELESTKEMGFDIFEIEAYIFKAISAFQDGNYVIADDLAKRAIGSAREKREGVDEGKIRIMLRNTEMLMVDCGELGIDIGVMEDGISRAERYLESRRLADAMELTEKLNAQVKEQIEVKLIEVIPQHIREMSGLIEAAEEEGADMEDESMSLISIETLNQEGRYLGAMKLIEPLRAAIEEKIGIQKKEKATSKLELAFADFNEYKMTAIGDYDELESLLDEALNASTEGDAEEMERKIEAYYDMKGEYEKQWAIEKHTIGINDMETQLSSITKLDIDVSTGTELVTAAKEQLEDESMDELEATMKELEAFVSSLFEDKIKPEAKENIKEIDRIMDRLREKGVEVNEEEELFSEILNAMDDEDYVSAHDKSSRLRVSVRAIWGHRRKDVLRDLLDELEDFLDELESNDLFSDQYKEMIVNAVDEIRDHFHAEEFDLMEEKHELFKGTIDDLKAKMKIRDEVDELQQEAIKYGETAEGIAADVAAELEELQKVGGMVENEEFEDAKALLEGLMKKMKKKINVRRMSIAKMVLEDAVFTFNDRKDKIDPGIVKTAQGLLSDATKLYKKGQFEKAIKMATELKEGLEDAEEIAPEAPEEPAPEPAAEEAPKPKKVKLTCPKCSKSYVAKIAKTPAVAVCPYCKSKAVIKSL